MKNWNYSEPYKSLLEAWKSEIKNEELQPLDFQFYNQISEQLEKIKTLDPVRDPLEHSIHVRFNWYLESLKTIRWKKIVNYLLRDLNIDDSFLTKEEIIFWKNLRTIFSQFNNFKENSTGNVQLNTLFLETQKNEEFIKPNENRTGQMDEMIEVVFLTDCEEFIAPNLKIYGPFKEGMKCKLPEKVVRSVLLPFKIVKTKEKKNEL